MLRVSAPQITPVVMSLLFSSECMMTRAVLKYYIIFCHLYSNMKKILALILCWGAFCVADTVPVRTDYSGINRGDTERNYRHRTLGAYLSNAALRRMTKTNNYSSYENPTGIWFEDGEKVTLTVSGLPQGYPLKLIVHDFEGDTAHREYSLQNGANKLTMESRGLAYIDYRGDSLDNMPPDIKVDISGGKINGVFTRQDSAGTWKKMLAEAKCGMLDMLGERCQLTFNIEGLRKGCPEKGPELLAKYDYLMELQQNDILGWDRDKLHPGNHIHGRAMWKGYMHADGQGAAFHISTIPGIANPDHLNRSAWGVAHEFGHVNQTRRCMCWTGMTEVTNNIFSAWTNYKLNPSSMRLEHERVGNADGQSMVGGRFDCYVNNAIVRRRIWLYHGGPDTSDDSLGKRAGDVFVTLCPYWQLQLYVAVARGQADFYPNIFREARATDESGLSNGEMQLLFIRRACDSARLNLTEFFVKVGMLSPMNREMEDYSRAYITITDAMCRETMEYISQYPAPDSSVIYYITANTVEVYRDRLPVIPPPAGAPQPAIQNDRLEIADCEWKNAVAFEAYRGDTLLRVSLRGLNHKDGQGTTVICPPGTDTVKAVQWDGKRYTVFSSAAE